MQLWHYLLLHSFLFEILITNGQISSVSITPPSPTGIAGEPLTLTCTANITAGVSDIPSFMWAGPESRGPNNGTLVQGSQSMYMDSLTLARVREDHSGMYTCEVSGNGTSYTDSVIAIAQVPPVSVCISPSGSNIAGRSYTLTCTLTTPSSLGLTTPSYQWQRNGTGLSGQIGQTLSFGPLSTSDSGQYACQYNATSPYLNNQVVRTASAYPLYVIVLVPSAPTNVMGSPQTTSVRLTWSQSPQDIVDSYTISYVRAGGCSSAPCGRSIADGSLREYSLTGLEEAITYSISIRAVNSGGSSQSSTYTATTRATVPDHITSPTSQSVSPTNITIMWQQEDCLLHNGQIRHHSVRYRETGSSADYITDTVNMNERMYTASLLYPRTLYTFEVALVNEVGTGPYNNTDISTSQPSSPTFFLGDVSYPNNSVVTLSDIGEDNNALRCVSNIIGCCTTREWSFPNATRVPSVDGVMIHEFGRDRRDGTARLHRRSSATGPTGVYTCGLDGVRLYVGIYPNGTGSPSISSLTYNVTSGVVTCVSTGGPATSVTWSRSGPSYQQSQKIVDNSTATYHNLLSITSSSLTDYTGSFFCTVSNSRGQSSESIRMFYESLKFSGHNATYGPGSSANIICSSDLNVHSIRWLNASRNRKVIVSNYGEQQLALEINKITRAINNTQYTCEVTIILPRGMERNSETVSLSVADAHVPASITVTDITSSGATIEWMFTEAFNALRPETCVVIYGTSPGQLDRRSSEVTADGRINYSIQLTSLAPAINYSYVIECLNQHVDVSASTSVMSFRSVDIMINYIVKERAIDEVAIGFAVIAAVAILGFIIEFVIIVILIRKAKRKRVTMAATMTTISNGDEDKEQVYEVIDPMRFPRVAAPCRAHETTGPMEEKASNTYNMLATSPNPGPCTQEGSRRESGVYEQMKATEMKIICH